LANGPIEDLIKEERKKVKDLKGIVKTSEISAQLLANLSLEEREFNPIQKLREEQTVQMA